MITIAPPLPVSNPLSGREHCPSTLLGSVMGLCKLNSETMRLIYHLNRRKGRGEGAPREKGMTLGKDTWARRALDQVAL